MNQLLLRRRIAMVNAEPEPPFDPMTSYLTFEAIEDDTRIGFCRYANQSQITLRTIEYSLDGGTSWTSYTGTGAKNYNMCTLQHAKDKIMLRGNTVFGNILGSTTYSRHMYFRFDRPVYVYGNINSLINSTEFDTLTTLPNNALPGVFQDAPILAHPTKELLLPTETIGNFAYFNLFNNCSQFNRIVCLAKTFGTSSTVGMTDGVATTGTFIKDATMTSWPSGADGIPTGWTVLNYE